MSELTRLDCELLMESLEFSELAVRQYRYYPDEQIRQDRLAHIQDVRHKVRALRRTDERTSP